MKVNRIHDIHIHPNAPMPKIISNDNSLYLIFYLPEEINGEISQLKVRNSILDKGITVVKFEGSLSYKFGSPNDETLIGHPLYKEGLEACGGFYVNDSSWILELEKINSVHPYHNSEMYKGLKHYILSFKDNTFECIAREYLIKKNDKDMFDNCATILQEILIEETE